MIAHTAPTTARAPWRETAQTLGHAISLSFWSGIVVWRWLLLIALFGFDAYLCEDSLRSYFQQDGIGRRADVWDVFPAMLGFRFSLLLLFGAGFLLLVGDSVRREQDIGATAMAVVRMPSRSIYWLGKLGALGLHALTFVGLALLMTLLVAGILAPPLSMFPVLPRAAPKELYPDLAISLPLFTLLLAAYTAWTLWVAGSLIVLVSLYIPHRLGALAAITLWLGPDLFGLVSSSSTYTVDYDYLDIINLGYFIGFFKHQGMNSMPVSPFLVLTAALMALIAFLGARRLQREEL